MNLKIIFFGSTSDSILVLEKLFNLQLTTCNLQLVSVVTQPPRPVGRKQILTPTPVEIWAKEHRIPVLNFATNPQKPWLYENEQTVIDALSPFKADLLISACYGQKIPLAVINKVRFGGLNVHPSILPRWRGADPVPWAILSGDRQTGVTIVTLAEKFDAGHILAQNKISISPKDASDPLRTKLFTIGSELLISILKTLSQDFEISPHVRKKFKKQEGLTYARRFNREDGFLPWKLIEAAMQPSFVPPNETPTSTEATADTSTGTTIQQFNNISIVKDYLKYRHTTNRNEPLGIIIERFFRALSPWPGVWTSMATQARPATQVHRKTQGKRLKILKLHLEDEKLVLDEVQLEGKKPAAWTQFKDAYLKTASCLL